MNNNFLSASSGQFSVTRDKQSVLHFLMVLGCQSNIDTQQFLTSTKIKDNIIRRFFAGFWRSAHGLH